jgi:hypothetical protein
VVGSSAGDRIFKDQAVFYLSVLYYTGVTYYHLPDHGFCFGAQETLKAEQKAKDYLGFGVVQSNLITFAPSFK